MILEFKIFVKIKMNIMWFKSKFWFYFNFNFLKKIMKFNIRIISIFGYLLNGRNMIFMGLLFLFIYNYIYCFMFIVDVGEIVELI